MAEKTRRHRQQARGPQPENLRDLRHGAYDPIANQEKPDQSNQSEHEKAQPGADVRGDPVPAHDFELPEGIRRQPAGPYNRDTGRGKERPKSND